MSHENKNPNHLIHEKSPYLLQHAYNPVNWYPWCEEAFTKARKEDKPIFLSIGYSTCHWCHVMERESFEDEKVAKILNDNFVSIKVDKEERPDVDTIYMNVCQRVNGHGGWPLTILMTPDQKPFFAGTYLPKHSRGQMYGLIELLLKVMRVWQGDKGQLVKSAEDLLELLKRDEKGLVNPENSGDEEIFKQAFQEFSSYFDKKHGGFGRKPKFPTPHNLLFLLRYAKQFQSEEALCMVEKTLEAMYRGGIYDHIGGGFARYSTDDIWLVPHFEKMLYDNALLVLAYTEVYQMTKKPLYQKVVKETLQYILAEMTDDLGGFYCAQDADSEGEEGKYYTFRPEEVIQVLGEDAGRKFNEYYDITSEGNFEGVNIPNRIGKDLMVEIPELEKWKEKLYEYRSGRTKLHKDDKILTSWNGLMITALAKAYQVFRESAYMEAAKKAYLWLQHNHRDETGRLMVRYREGHVFGAGNLEDYAYLLLAQLTLYEVSLNPVYLLEATKDAKDMIQYFYDEENGGFYFYGNDVIELILRPKEVYDGAMPSGNTVAAYVLAKLDKITRNDMLTKVCEKQMNWLYGSIKEYPSAYSFGLCALLIQLSEFKEIVCVIGESIELVELFELMQEYYMPNAVIIAIEENTKETLGLVAPYTKEYKPCDKKAEVYICENFSCQPPLKGIEAFKEFLDKHS